MPDVALVTIVHDEQAWLDAFLDHHRAIGVEHAYVYLDRCTDRSGPIASSRPWVTTVDWDRPPECRWLSEFQALVLPDAYERAEADGFEWLAFLDVDEFAWAGSIGSIDLEEGRLDRLTDRVDDDVDAVRLQTVEVVPEAIPMRTESPEVVRTWALAHVQPEPRFQREITDPTTGEPQRLPGFLGHPRGKLLVRTGRGLVPDDAHTWRDGNGEPVAETGAGCHLHLVVADGEHFWDKYRKLDPHPLWPTGDRVPFPKRAFVEAAAAMSPAEAADYFEREVAVSPQDLTRGLVENTVLRWPLLRHTLDAAGHEPLRVERATRQERVARSREGHDGRARPPVVVIGLDAFDRDLVEPGRFEALDRLVATGRVTPTEAPPGLFTGAVWPSVWTGAHAGEHGYHCWKQIRPGTYDFELHQVHHHGLAREPFWARARDQGLRAVVIDPPHAPLVEGLRGAQVLEWGGHDAVTPPFSDPPELIDEVLDRHGEHPSWGNCNEHDRDADAYVRFRDDLIAGVDARAELTLELDERVQPDLLVTVFGEAHCIGHQAWHLHDPGSDGHERAVVDVVGDPVLDVYAAVDRAVGRLRRGLDPDSEVFVLLSHGMGPHTDPTYLVDDVLLRLDASRRFERERRRVQAGERLVARLGPAGALVAPVVRALATRLHRRTFDWIHSAGLADRRWFQQPNNEPEAGIRLNLVGREPEGIIEPDRFEVEVAWLRSELEALRDDDGRPVVRDVLVARDRYAGPALDVLPDLLVRWNRRSAMVDRLSSPTIGEVHRPYVGARTGDHHPRGLLIHVGPSVEPGVDEEPIPSDAIADRVLAALQRTAPGQV